MKTQSSQMLQVSSQDKEIPLVMQIITSTLVLLDINLEKIQFSQGHWLCLIYLIPEM